MPKPIDDEFARELAELSHLAGAVRRVAQHRARRAGWGVRPPPPRPRVVATNARPDARPDARPPEAATADGSPARAPDAAAEAAAARLREIRAELGDCQRCRLCEKRQQIVFGAGNPRAGVMFVGEGPGRDEDIQGIPFVGKAGQLLTKMIGAMGLDRDDVYITNVVKCRPPRNRDPEADEVAACEPFLRQQVEAIDPVVIVALGRYAAQTLLGDDRSLSRLRGRFHDYEGRELLATYHPAYLLRNPGGKRGAWEDLQKVMDLLDERGVPRQAGAPRRTR